MVADWNRYLGWLLPVSTVHPGGCAETMPLVNLPNIAKLPEKVLNKDEQQKAMNQMIEKGQSQQAEAAKQTEKAK